MLDRFLEMSSMAGRTGIGRPCTSHSKTLKAFIFR